MGLWGNGMRSVKVVEERVGGLSLDLEQNAGQWDLMFMSLIEVFSVTYGVGGRSAGRAMISL